MRVLAELSLPLVKVQGFLVAAKGPQPQVSHQSKAKQTNLSWNKIKLKVSYESVITDTIMQGKQYDARSKMFTGPTAMSFLCGPIHSHAS